MINGAGGRDDNEQVLRVQGGGYLVRGGDRTSDGAGLAFEFETGTDALYFEDKIQRDEDLEHKAFRGVEGGKPLSQL